MYLTCLFHVIKFSVSLYASENATPEELRIAKQCAPTTEGDALACQIIHLFLVTLFAKNIITLRWKRRGKQRLSTSGAFSWPKAIGPP